VLLLVHLQQILLTLQVFLELFNLIEVDLRNVLLLVLSIINYLLHNEQPRIELVPLLGRPPQISLQHLILMRQLAYRVVEIARTRGCYQGTAIGGKVGLLLFLAFE
jgi:hypothetical protein